MNIRKKIPKHERLNPRHAHALDALRRAITMRIGESTPEKGFIRESYAEKFVKLGLAWREGNSVTFRPHHCCCETEVEVDKCQQACLSIEHWPQSDD